MAPAAVEMLVAVEMCARVECSRVQSTSLGHGCIAAHYEVRIPQWYISMSYLHSRSLLLIVDQRRSTCWAFCVPSPKIDNFRIGQL